MTEQIDFEAEQTTEADAASVPDNSFARQMAVHAEREKAMTRRAEMTKSDGQREAERAAREAQPESNRPKIAPPMKHIRAVRKRIGGFGRIITIHQTDNRR